MPSDARACANAVLRRVFEHGAYADRAFHRAARGLPPRDRALAMQIAYGAIQRRGTLDALIEGLTERSPNKLDGAVLAAMRAGLYELLYLGGGAPHAIVDDAVELVKRSGSRGHGLANAALRRAAREGDALLARLHDDTAEGAAGKHSHPLWLAEMWWRELGRERANALMAANNEPRERAIRVNTLVASPAAVVAELPVPSRVAAPLGGIELEEALVLDGPLDLVASAPWQRGAAIAQSRAAMLVARLVAPERGESVLDLCAAPGGKSTHLAALMENSGEVIALERDAKRASQLVETVKRMKAGCVRVVEGDAERLFSDASHVRRRHFDRVLLDPPCSGLGTLQARPDLRWRMTPERIASLVRAQARMLAAAAEAVADGGTLVYSTCTISEAENEQQIDAFLNARPDFSLEPASAERRFFATSPSEDSTAGFFVARLRRG